MLHDLVIVGSGPAGVWAAWQASRRGLRPLLLDVGEKPPVEKPLERNLYDLRREDPAQADYLIGSQFESLHNLYRPFASPKVKSPRYQFVTRGSETLAPTQSLGFQATQSFARGGLANAWGASVYRYDDRDLKAFPFGTRDLDPYYDVLTAEIGISGAQDDLAQHFGWKKGLQPPLRTDRVAARLLRHYEGHRSRFQGRGIKIGLPHLALLSQEHKGRQACRYDNLSFWQPGLPSIYTPAMTLQELIAEGRVDYRDGWLAESFAASGSEVLLRARQLQDGERRDFRARKLILAAGALNSARLVLKSFGDTQTRLPLLENPTTLTPFVHAMSIGTAVQKESHGLAQLNAVYEGPHWDSPVKGTFYGYSSPLASDVFRDFPLAARGVLACSKYLLPAMSVLQLFYRDAPDPDNHVFLREDGSLVTRCASQPSLGAVEKQFMRALLPAGFISHRALSRTLPAGNGIHYAGTLPMSSDPALRYRTDGQGRLSCAAQVHIADAAVFPELPAKNHTFTVMAVAMRVADAVADALGGAG
jgi:choline dehydrogenase-like flavoprotein